ncbi:MAG: hypothetical protein HOP17_07255 [Acidobacteria bacterium]|nr:hypothetical protein [Acidobacteriota bacterium]
MYKNSLAILFLIVLSVCVFPGSSNGYQFGEWSAPVNLGPPINSKFVDSAAVLTEDGLNLFFTSTRPGGSGNEDLWVASRSSVNSPWGQPVNLGSSINAGGLDRLRSITPDGHILLFQSDRAGGVGGNDIWASYRESTKDNFGWQPPVNMGSVINTNSEEVAANYLFESLGTSSKLFFSTARPDMGLGNADIYTSEITPAGTFGPPVNVRELNSPYRDTCFWVRDDGLEIIFSSSRAAMNNDLPALDMWVSTRASTLRTWSPPVRLPYPINMEGFLDVNPSLSAGNTVMLFTSERPGGEGVQDIYMTTRKAR